MWSIKYSKQFEKSLNKLDLKIKRQVRSIIDEALDLKNEKYDYIVAISKNYSIDEFAKNKALLVKLLNSIKEK